MSSADNSAAAASPEVEAAKDQSVAPAPSPAADPIVAEPTSSSAEPKDGPVTAAENNTEDATEEKAETAEAAEAASAGQTNWWGGWTSLEKAVSSVSSVTSSAVQVAKEKSNEVYGLVSKDLGEVSSQATSAVGTTASTLKRSLEFDWLYCDPNSYYWGAEDVPISPSDYEEGKGRGQEQEEEFDDKTDEMADKAVETVKKSVSSFWNYASGYAGQMFSEEDLASEALLVTGGDSQAVVLDRLQAQLYALASDPDTYLTEPDPKDQLTDEWRAWTCDLEKRQGEIADLTRNNQHVRQHYTSMVPGQVSHKLFWTRYFFKVHLLELQEAKRRALKKRAEEARLDSDSDINWDELVDGDDLGDVDKDKAKAKDDDIPHELQDKLLSDYERELITQRMKKADDSATASATARSVGDELAQLDLSASAASAEQAARASPGSSQEKESIASDDWEKLSAGERSPKKNNREEEDWVKT